MGLGHDSHHSDLIQPTNQPPEISISPPLPNGPQPDPTLPTRDEAHTTSGPDGLCPEFGEEDVPPLLGDG